MKLNYNKLLEVYNKRNDEVSNSLGLSDLEDFEDFVEGFCSSKGIQHDHDKYLNWFDSKFPKSFEVFGNGHVGIENFDKLKSSFKEYCDIDIIDENEITSEMLENLIDSLSKTLYNKYIKDVYGVDDDV